MRVYARKFENPHRLEELKERVKKLANQRRLNCDRNKKREGVDDTQS